MCGIIHCHDQHHHHQHHHHCQHHQDAHYGETGGCLVDTMVNTMVSGEHARIKTLLSCYTQRAIIVTITVQHAKSHHHLHRCHHSLDHVSMSNAKGQQGIIVIIILMFPAKRE